MKKIGFTVFIFILIFTSAIHAKTTSSQMALTTYDGKILDINITEEGFKFKQFPNKTVLLNFFGPMCPPCIIEMPHLIELQEKHKDDLQIVTVQVQIPMENSELADFVKKNKINYPVINLNDAWDIVTFVKANTNWGGEIPFMMMFGKDGELRNNYIGVVSTDKLLKDMR